MTSRPSEQRTRAGVGREAPAFTLIELLVVIAILALLISIMVPSLKEAREYARLVVCEGNLRSQGMAAALYMEDWHQYLEFSVNHWGSHYGTELETLDYAMTLLPYTSGRETFKCPSRAGLTGEWAYGVMWAEPITTWDTNSPWYYAKYSLVKQPAKLHMYVESSTIFLDVCNDHCVPRRIWSIWPALEAYPYCGDKQYSSNHWGPADESGMDPAFMLQDTRSRTVAVCWDGHIEVGSRHEWFQIDPDDSDNPWNNN